MLLGDQIKVWAEFFAEKPCSSTGFEDVSDETDLTDEEKEEKKGILIQIIQKIHLILKSTTLYYQYLSTKSSLQHKALAVYTIHGDLTDAELGEHLQLGDRGSQRAGDVRRKDSIAEFIEAKSDEKPTRYGLTAAARVTEEETLRSWLQSQLDAIERAKRLQEERAAAEIAAGKLPKVSGSLSAELAEQFRKGDYAVKVSFPDLARHNPDLAELLLDNPSEALKAAELALNSFDGHHDAKFKILVSNLPESSRLSLREVRTRHIGRLLELVVEPESVSEVRPIVVSARFECPSCGNIIPVQQIDQKFKEPSRCGCGRLGKFHLLSKVMHDFAVIGLTQPLGEVLGGQGRRSQMKLHLDGELASSVRMVRICPGVPLKITAFPRETPVSLRSGGQSVRYELVLDGVYYEPVEDYSFSLAFTPEEVESFKAAVTESSFFEDFSESCFPSHHGDGHIKKALALQLLSGRFDGRTQEEVLNVYLSGEPGTGKTLNFLRRSASLAPISRFVEATSSTQAGLLGSSSTKDQDSGRFVYEPGALTRAHRGLIVIDELAALLPEETKALNEALQDGSVTIDKATLHLVVPVDVCCLAAGNPKGGRFDPVDGVTGDAIGIEPSTLNRFDLVYCLIDGADAERDERVIKRMFGVADVTQRFSDSWLRRFILYARYAIKPKLRGADASTLTRFYVGMRQGGITGKLPISPRHAETLRALALLSAKLHLRSETNEEDVSVSAALIEPMLKQFGYNLSTIWGVLR